MGEAKLNEIILYSMPNIWIKQAYLQGFNFPITHKKAITMFECMEIIELIYKGLVEKPLNK